MKFAKNRDHRSCRTYKTYQDFADTRDAGVVANIALCLTHQANYLLDKQIARLEKGSLKELMYQARANRRKQRPNK